MTGETGLRVVEQAHLCCLGKVCIPDPNCRKRKASGYARARIMRNTRPHGKGGLQIRKVRGVHTGSEVKIQALTRYRSGEYSFSKVSAGSLRCESSLASVFGRPKRTLGHESTYSKLRTTASSAPSAVGISQNLEFTMSSTIRVLRIARMA